MSMFHLEEGWYTSARLTEIQEINKKLNDHLAKSIGELAEGQTLTTHKWKPQHEWVGLSDEEIYEAVENSNSVLVKDMARAIEAKLKEKNGG